MPWSWGLLPSRLCSTVLAIRRRREGGWGVHCTSRLLSSGTASNTSRLKIREPLCKFIATGAFRGWGHGSEFRAQDQGLATF
jgi:hypothetical protein